MQDALISAESFSILSGAGLTAASKDEPVYVHTTAQIQVKEKNTIELKEAPCWNKFPTNNDLYHKNADIFVMTMTNGQIDSEPCVPVTVDGKVLTCYSHSGTIDVGDIVFVDYYVKRTGGAQTIEITPDKFGGYYYIEASTLFRDEQTGVDMPAEFVIPKAKVQSNFTFNMAASGDPSVFDFTMDAFPDYTKFDETKKVLAAISIITEAVDDQNDKREPCVPLLFNEVTENIQVTADNDGTEELSKLTVTGSGVNGTYHNPEAWGNAIPADVAIAEFDIQIPVTQGETYTLITRSPLHQYYFGSDDRILEDEKGLYKTQTKEMTGSTWDIRSAVSNLKGDVSFELRNADDEVVRTIIVNNKVSFAKSYAVDITGVDKIKSMALNENPVTPIPTSMRVVSGDVICLELNDPILGSVKANDRDIKQAADKTYTVKVSGTTKITVE